MKRRDILLVAALASTAAPAPAAVGEMPVGWQKTGSHAREYDMGLDYSVRHDGRASASIQCNTDEPHGFGALVQIADAAPYRGKRLRLSGQIKTAKVAQGWAGLLLRVDGPVSEGESHGRMLAMDNMAPRGIKGTTDWTRYEIVLDVAEEAATLHYGALLEREGQVWVDSLKLETVTLDVPLTGTPLPPRTPGPRRTPPPPQNLDFDKPREPI